MRRPGRPLRHRRATLRVFHAVRGRWTALSSKLLKTPNPDLLPERDKSGGTGPGDGFLENRQEPARLGGLRRRQDRPPPRPTRHTSTANDFAN